MLVPLGLALVLAAGQSDVAPAPTASPLKEIIRVRSTAFCTVFRENVFRAAVGLTVNDTVIAQGDDLIGKLDGEGLGHSMAQYRLGQTVYQAASNLTKVYQLLDDKRLEQSATDDDRDLRLMKARLEAVADAQERSLNVLSGTYETSSLNDLANRGHETYESFANPSPDKVRNGVAQPDPTANEPTAAMGNTLAAPRRLTGQAEDRIAPAVLPGIDRCGSN